MSSRTSCSIPARCRSLSARSCSDYYDTLERYRLLTYGQQIARAVEELQKPAVAAAVHADAAASDRRRVPGRQPGAGAADRLARRARASSSASSATTTRRSISGAVRMWRTSSTFATRFAPASRRSVSRPTAGVAPADHRGRERFARIIPNRLEKDDAAVPSARGRRPRGRRLGGGRRAGRPARSRSSSCDLIDDRGVRYARHRRPGARAARTRSSSSSSTTFGIPVAARWPHRAFRPAGGDRPRAHDLLDLRHRVAKPLRAAAAMIGGEASSPITPRCSASTGAPADAAGVLRDWQGRCAQTDRRQPRRRALRVAG